MKIAHIFLFALLFTTCKPKSKYQKAADDIASRMPESREGMNAGSEEYDVYVPEGWTTNQRSRYGINYYYLLAPKTADDPNTNINILTESMRGKNAEGYREGTIAGLKRVVPSASIIDQGEIEAVDQKALWFSYSMAEQGIEASLVCYIFPRDTVAYVMTAGTQTKDFGRYRSLFDTVARSFRFK